MRTVAATRYVTPLREGGSLPAIVEADDEGLYVIKFRGAGQGPRALLAELVAGELARSEPDPEIQDLIRASAGVNIALDYMPGSVAFDPVAEKPDAELASAIVWFDALVVNIDRSPRNTNLLMWHGKLRLIDHGAALYVHHAGGDFATRAKDAFPKIKDHVLLPFATRLAEVDAGLAARLGPEVIERIVASIPDDWIAEDSSRETYARYLEARLAPPRAFVEEALRARSV